MTRTVTTMARNPLDEWAARRTGAVEAMLSHESIAEYQLGAVRETVAWARRNSSFYAAQLATFPEGWPWTLGELAQAPLTSPADLVGRGHEFLCVPQSEISRIVSLESSGTSGMRKRVFFTTEDQDLALEFFAYGVTAMADKGDRMLIALPVEREGSVGFQLARGVARAGVKPIPYGLVLDATAALRCMDEEKATIAIGLPVQMLAVAMESGEMACRVFRRLHTMILCSDHVPQSLVQRIRQATGCEIFEHYGSTEMGLGGSLDCYAHEGYHLREADLYFEAVSPRTGESVADGEMGEVVFTTLGRQGMPLIRYRTGDVARILRGTCSCGSPLRRLVRVRSRVDGDVVLGSKGCINMAALDEALFAIPEVYDFTATLAPGNPNALEVCIYAPQGNEELAMHSESALTQLTPIDGNCAIGELRITVRIQREPFPVTGAKRKIGVRAIL